MTGARTRLVHNYSSAADGYAEFWSPLIRPPACRMLAALPWEGKDRILDVGTGTGALLPDLRSFAPAAAIVGVDLAPGMLKLARQTRARLAMMDAAELALRAAAFDGAVMAFVLFHLPSPTAGLQEVRRVLRPGGSLGVTTWAEEIMPAVSQLWDEELAAAGARDPSPQPPRQHELMNTTEKLGGLLTDAGFVVTRAWIERIEHRWDVARFTGMRTRFGETKRKLGTLDAVTRHAVLERIASRMARAGPDDLLYRGAVVCAVARTAA